MADLYDRANLGPQRPPGDLSELEVRCRLGRLTPCGVLVGMDGSKTSVRAVDFALGYALRAHAGVVGVYVRPMGAMASLAVGATPCGDPVYDEISAELQQYLAERAAELGIAHGFVEVRGEPVRELRRCAAALSANTLVVGASTRLDHRIIGSVGAALARKARQPVIVVP